METSILEELQEKKNAPCISIIVPAHRKSGDRQQDPVELRKVMKNLRELVRVKYGFRGNGAAKVLESVDKMVKRVDFLHNEEGLGFFASPGFAKMVKFPFPVKEKVMVGDNFEIRDVLYLEEQMIKYFLLSVTEKGARLFEGRGPALKEIRDENFPMKYEDDYIYIKPGRGSTVGNALKSTEGDKSLKEEKRLIANLKRTDEKLLHYLEKNNPLVVAGVPKEMGYFKKITIHKKKIAGIIDGNYNYWRKKIPGGLAFDEIRSWLLYEENKLMDKLDKAFSKKQAVSGIEEVWAAANEGSGLLLMVERDYSVPGFISERTQKFYKKPPREKHRILTDAVDDIMELVLEKNGKVVVVENGKLLDHNGIALMLRYRRGE